MEGSMPKKLQPWSSRLIGLVCAGALAGTLVVATAPSDAALRDWLPWGKTHTLAKLLPSVVNIEVLSFKPDPNDKSAPPRRVQAFGSGFIVDPSGYIVTNHHVVDGVSEVHVTFKDGPSLPAKIVGDAGFNVDLALLKVEPEKPLPAVKWGNSRDVRVGDSVFVIGNPLGIGESVSAGIVSALNRNITETPYDDFIQTDAAINHGNSGGPMVDVHGEVVGVATALFSPTDAGSIGLGFAIPAYDVQFVIDRLRKYGDLHFGFMGMRMQDVTTDMADALGLKPPRGAIIASVLPEAPAAAAGVEPGDVVLMYDNKPFTDIRALGRMIATSQIGATVPVTVWRGGKEVKLSAKIDKFPEEMPAKDSGKAGAGARVFGTNPAQIGMDLESLTDEGREKFKLAGAVSGVLVSGVTPNTTASDQGLAAGDVIVRVQNVAVSTPEEVQQRLADALAQNRHFALLLVQTPDEKKWITVPISGGN
jgi:serine protease Do